MDVQRVQQQQQKQITGVLVFHFPFISVHRPCAARMSPSEAALIERKNFPFFSVFVVGCAGQSNLENGGDGAKATTREETKREKKRRRFQYRKRSRENGGANRTRRRRTCGIGGHPTFTEQNKNDSEPSTTSMWIRLSPSESQKRERGKKRKTMDSNAAKSSTKDKAKIQPNEQRENHSLKIDGRTS